MVKRNRLFAILIALGVCMACVAETSVMPVNSSENRMSEICIKLNPKIPMPEFTYILEEGFSRHGIATKIRKNITPDCEYSLIYTAQIDKPDTKPVLNDVHLAIYRGAQLIGYADRDPPKGLLQGGGVELTRWDTTRAKIEPMLDELLQSFSPTALMTPGSTLSVAPPASSPAAPLPLAVSPPMPTSSPSSMMPVPIAP